MLSGDAELTNQERGFQGNMEQGSPGDRCIYIVAVSEAKVCSRKEDNRSNVCPREQDDQSKCLFKRIGWSNEKKNRSKSLFKRIGWPNEQKNRSKSLS